MTNTLLRMTAVSITALSLSACMSGQGSPWSPEFGQAHAPTPHQSAHYQYGQYPMPNAPVYAQPPTQNMAEGHMQSPEAGSSQHLSPLPNTYPPQPMTQGQQQQRSYQGYSSKTPAQSAPGTAQPMPRTYGSPYASSATTSTYQQPSQMQPAASTPTQMQQGYQTQYAPAPSQVAPATNPYMGQQNMGQQIAPTQYSYNQQMNTHNPFETPYVQSLGTQNRQAMRAPYAQTMQNMTQPQQFAQQQQQYPMQAQAMQSNPMQSQSMQPQPMQTMQSQPMQSNGIPWGQAMAWMYQGHVKSASQANGGMVTLTLHNGQTVDTQSPRMDDVMRVKQDCGAACQNMMIATE